MNIGVIGSGNVGGALGSRWARNGHSVSFGTRNPEADDTKELLKRSGPTAKAVPVKEALQGAEVLLFATPWPATKGIIEGLGSLEGRIVIDATNPLLPDLSGLELGNTTSGAEQVAKWTKGAKVVKAFNTVGFGIMANTDFGSRHVAMLYCSDHDDAKTTVRPLIEELGFEAIDAGPLKQARTLEPFALLWITLANFYGYGREIAFQFIRR
jgi:8-hydroxy-5-deazaflavin:NADPH oxidoreductase